MPAQSVNKVVGKPVAARTRAEAVKSQAVVVQFAPTKAAMILKFIWI
jgi:hypothetical protein